MSSVDLTDAQKRLLETYPSDRLRKVLLELQDRLEGITGGARVSGARMLDGTPIHDPSKVEQKDCGCSPFEYCRKCQPEAFEESDPVNHPPHYTQGSIECIDAIEAMLMEGGVTSYLRGQVVKYIWRMGLKGDALEDARKAQFYVNRLVEVLDDKNTGGS